MYRWLTIVVATIAFGGCSRPTPIPTTEPIPVVPLPPDEGSIPLPRVVQPRSPAQALAQGVDYLLAQQSPDGAWRSDVYATFKDGTALTPFVVTALQDAHDAGVRNPAIESAIQKGLAWLAKLSKADGIIDPGPDGLDYPLYTASLTIKAFSHPSGNSYLKLRGPWVKYLKDRQLTESIGWKPDEKQFGGWGYCRVIPKKPPPNQIAPPLIESNLSATVFALDALHVAGELDAETIKKAVIFVRRCQNDDGGFHFIYDDPTRNKAGMASTEPLVFHSYGSTTADGLRALILCGDAVDSGRRDKAREWLVKHFRADTHPGTYIKSHEPNREAVYFYYAASVSKGLSELKVTQAGGIDWSAEIGAHLAKRQYRDGSWMNPVELVRENDPLIATSSAISALSRRGR